MSNDALKTSPDLPTLQDAKAVLQRLAARAQPSARAHVNDLTALLSQMSEGIDSDSPEGLLRRAEAKYRALVEQIPAVTFMAPLDGSTTELYVSPQIEELLGFSQKQWLEDPVLWFRQLHPEDKDRWQEHFARTVNAGEPFRAEYRFMAQDGRTVWVHGEAKLVTDPEGRLLFLQGVAFDITESKEAEAELRRVNTELAFARDQALEASRAKSAFLANMSHELRTPLNAIIGYSELLRDEAADAGQLAFVPDLQKIHGAAKHLLSLIKDILDLAKIEVGKMELFSETFDVADVIRDVATTIDPLVENNSNRLEIVCPDDIGSMQADLTKLRQVLFNLLSNACKFTENGLITLQVARLTEQGKDWIHFTVKDTGIGMSAAQMEKLFQEFTQGDDSTTRKYGGTGLGLAISQHFCRMMRGNIFVTSELGKGATFTARLPAERGPATLDATASPPIGVVRSSQGNTVLVIDDDPLSLDLLSRFLEKEGFHAVSASRGDEGLRLARELHPTAIVLDVLIPGMDGWAVLTALKSEPALADIPVIIVTIIDNPSMSFALGAADYMAKPIDQARLAAKLRKYRCPEPPCTVLIVEDDAEARDLMTRLLHKEGWNVLEAENGRVALELMKHNQPSLIMLDLMMPEMDGFEFARQVRKNDEWRSIPVVVITAKDLNEGDRQRLSSQVANIHQKGEFSREDLLREVRDLMLHGIQATRQQPRG